LTIPNSNPKATTPEDLVAGIFNAFLGGAPTASAQAKPKEEKPTPDVFAETQRLLVKAEKVSVGHDNEADILLAIADRQIRILENALAYQK